LHLSCLFGWNQDFSNSILSISKEVEELSRKYHVNLNLTQTHSQIPQSVDSPVNPLSSSEDEESMFDYKPSDSSSEEDDDLSINDYKSSDVRR